MISSAEDDDFTGLHDADRPLPLGAFRRERLLEEKLREEAIALAGQMNDDGAPGRIADFLARIPYMKVRLRALACVISHLQGLPKHLATIGVVLSQLETTFENLVAKSTDEPVWMQAWLNDVLCSLLCLDRELLDTGAQRSDLEGLRNAFFTLCKRSGHEVVFKDMHGVKGHKVLGRALAYGEHCLSLGLACSPPMNAARYASLMCETGARLKRCVGWTAELRRLSKADRGSFIKVAWQLGAALDSLPECALMVSVLGGCSGSRWLHDSQEEQLLELRIRAVYEEGFDSILVLAHLYRMWDAACQDDRSPMGHVVDDLIELLATHPGYLGDTKLLRKLHKAVDKQVKPLLHDPALHYVKFHWPLVSQSVARLSAL